jgi:parallel beta-helix repeat protein
MATSRTTSIGLALIVVLTAGSAGRASAATGEPTRRTLAPSCDGISVLPGANLQAKINAQPEGTTFCLKTGVHALTTGVLVKSRDRIIGEPGAVLDGQNLATKGLYGFPGPTGQRDVVVARLSFKRFRVAAISTGWGWLVLRNNVRTSDFGVLVNSGAILRDNVIHHNRRIGVSGGPVSTIVLDGNHIAFNNTRSYDVAVHAGGIKIIGGAAGSSAIEIYRNWIHDNTGRGLWLDTNVRDVTIGENLIEDNTSHGIFYETSWDGVIRDNRVLNNAAEHAGKSCFWGSQIHVNDSQNVEIDGNEIRSSDGSNGVCAVDIDRTSISSDKVAGLFVHGNVIRLREPGTTGLVGRPSAYQASAKNVFADNTYYVTETGAKSWAWSTYPVGWVSWRDYGNDLNGSVRLW